MDEREPVVSGDKLNAMSPAEREAAFTAALVDDLAEVPTPLLDRVRATVRARAGQHQQR